MAKKKNLRQGYWKEEEENIIRDWADKAQCYHWMHSKCHNIYKSKNTWFTIPVIIISTITGTANFAQDRFSEDIKEYVVMGIGSLSILAGIITTIQQFLKISELNEAHRASTISWSKFHNILKTIVSRHPLDRDPPSQTIKMYCEEYERLIEISPPILKSVIVNFNKTFRKNTELSKPEICSKLDSTNVFQMSAEERKNMIRGLSQKKPKNKKLMNTFYDINGRLPSDHELFSLEKGNVLEELGDMNIENNSISSSVDNSSEKGEEEDLNLSISSGEDNINLDIASEEDGEEGEEEEEEEEEEIENSLPNDNFINTSSV